MQGNFDTIMRKYSKTAGQTPGNRCFLAIETNRKTGPSPIFCGTVLLTVLLATLILPLPRFAGAANEMTDLRPNTEMVRYFYGQAKKTEPSMVDARQHEQVIRDRLQCYFDNPVFTARMNNCNNHYINRIIELARASLTARPSMGDFVRKINTCPVIHNLCMGEVGVPDECILLERKCIDYFLDEFWRGNWEHTLKEME